MGCGGPVGRTDGRTTPSGRACPFATPNDEIWTKRMFVWVHECELALGENSKLGKREMKQFFVVETDSYPSKKIGINKYEIKYISFLNNNKVRIDSLSSPSQYAFAQS